MTEPNTAEEIASGSIKVDGNINSCQNIGNNEKDKDTKFELVDWFIVCHEDSGDIEHDEKAARRFNKDVEEFERLLYEHTAQTMDRLRWEIEQREDDLEEKISKLNLSGNPDDWILANGIENVKMGVHSVLQLIEEVSDE